MVILYIFCNRSIYVLKNVHDKYALSRLVYVLSWGATPQASLDLTRIAQDTALVVTACWEWCKIEFMKQGIRSWIVSVNHCWSAKSGRSNSGCALMLLHASCFMKAHHNRLSYESAHSKIPFQMLVRSHASKLERHQTKAATNHWVAKAKQTWASPKNN